MKVSVMVNVPDLPNDPEIAMALIDYQLKYHDTIIRALREEKQKVCPHKNMEHVYVVEHSSPRGVFPAKIDVDAMKCHDCGLVAHWDTENALYWQLKRQHVAQGGKVYD